MKDRKITRPKIYGRKIQDYVPPPLNLDEFRELFHALRVIIYNRNITGTARALGISMQTAKGWITRPPTNPHTNVWLRHVLMQQIKYAQHHKRREVRQRAADALIHINQFAKSSFRPTADTAVELEDEEADIYNTCARFLLEVVCEDGPISTTRLRGGRFSQHDLRTYRRAAEQLCLDRLTRGFGDSKETWYFLPGDLPAVPEPDYTDSRSYKLYVERVKK